jgi:PAS domain S-box-containing protein
MTDAGPGEPRGEEEDEPRSASPEETSKALAQLEQLRRQTRKGPSQEQERLEEALEQLSVALEEIQVAEAELRHQNEELAGAQSLLDAERRRYRELFDFAPEAYVVTDLDGNIEELNQAATALLGWRQKGLVGKPLANYVAQSGRREFRQRLHHLRSGGRVENWLIEMRTVSGAHIPASIVAEAVLESDHQVATLRWLIRDVAKETADRARIEDELSFRRSLLESQGEASIEGILVADAEGSIVSFNRRFEEMWGIGTDVLTARSDEAVMAAMADRLRDAETFRQRVARLHAHPEEEARDELELQDGRVFHRFSAPVTGPDGTHFGRVWFFRDVTEERHRIRERDELLARSQDAQGIAETATARVRKLQAITDVMLRHVGVEELLPGLLDAVREAMGTDTATILMLTPDQKNLAVRAVSGEDDEVVGEIRVPVGHGIAGRVAAERRSRIVENVPAAGPYSGALRSKVKSMILVPLMVGERLIGVAHAASFTRRVFTEEDVHLLELVAERAAVAIETAGLYDAEQRARRFAEEAARRTTALQAVTAALSEAVTPDQVAEVMVERGILALGAVAGLMALVNEEGTQLEIVRSTGYPQEMLDRWHSFPLDAPLPLSDAVRTGVPVWLGSVADRERRYPDLAATLSLPDHAVAAVPMRIEGRAVGGMVFRFEEPRAFDEHDTAFMIAIARQATLAMERARLFEAERQARSASEVAQLRLAFLAEAGAIMSGSLQLSAALRNLARLAVAFLTDLCLIDVRDDDGTVRRLAAVHADPEKQPLADVLRTRYAPDPRGGHPAVQVMQTGRSQFAAEMPEDFLRRITQDPEHLRIAQELGFQSYICVPLLTRGQTLGTLTLVSCSPERRYGSADVALAEELARRAASAVDNATLYEQAVAARSETELAMERTAALQSVSAALAEALTPAEVAEVIVERGLTALSATAGSIVMFTGDRSELEILRAFGYADEIIEPWNRFAADSPVPLAVAAGTGEPVFLASTEEAEERFPGLIAHPPSGNQAWAAIPLTVEGRTIGAMGVSFPELRTFPVEERTFMLALARQCAQALERARLYESERSARAEAEQAEDRLAFLAEASEVLASSLDIEITLASIARLTVPRLADWCSIDLLVEDGSLMQVAVVHRNASKESLARELRERYPPERDPPHAIWNVLQTGQPEIAREINDHDLVARAKDPEHVKLLRQLGIRSHMIVPLVARGRTMGAISLIRSESGHGYQPEDLVLAEDLGRRAAIAIDNSRLYRAELAARQAAELAGEEVTFLSEATATLSASLPDYERMLEQVARLAVPVLADLCLIDVIEPDGTLRHVIITRAEQAGLLTEELEPSLHDPARSHLVTRVLATGEPRVIADVSQALREASTKERGLLASLQATGAGSVMIFPLRARQRNLGAITFVSSGSRRNDDEERRTRLAEELARRAALVLDNARLFELQRNIAQVLQRSLLPASLPEIPGMELAARYRAVGEGNEVGGDFYDAFEVTDGAWILAIGDVCGKGPEAAAVTGLARHTLRAVAFREQRPSTILRMLNESILREIGDERFCTVCCVRVRPGPGGARVTVSSGGHPLPLILRADGSLETAGQPSMLLGVLPDVHPTDHAISLGQGDTMILYTDGVVEQDRAGIEPGTLRLARIIQSNVGAEAAAMAESIERSVVTLGLGTPRDDVAVLVLRVKP